jgi:hypothetical protein
MPWRCFRKWRHSSTILGLGTRCEWAVSFMPQPLYTLGNSPLYPFHRRQGEPQSWSGLSIKKKNLSCPWWESNPCHPARSPLLYWLYYAGMEVTRVTINYILAFFCVQNYGHDNSTTFIIVFSLRNRIVPLLYSHTVHTFIAVIMGMTFYLDLGFLHPRRT